jgi:hypothetical protein
MVFRWFYLKGYVPMASVANATSATRNTVADWVNRECAKYSHKNAAWRSEHKSVVVRLSK